MQITLNEKRVAMWFLGKPKEVKVSLTFAAPGPVEVDFKELDEDLKRQVLIDLQREVILADVPFADLRAIYLIGKSQTPTAELLENQKTVGSAEKNPKIDVQGLREKKYREKATYLVKRSVNGIKTALNKEKDPLLFKIVLDLEGAKSKPRTSVVEYLQERLGKVQEEIQLALTQSAAKPITALPKDLGDSFVVEDTDQEVIIFAARPDAP